jgi:hypothetical protein
MSKQVERLKSAIAELKTKNGKLLDTVQVTLRIPLSEISSLLSSLLSSVISF